MTLLASLVLSIAEKGPDPADVKPGWLGFVVFLALAAATFLLWMSFRRQLKRVDFEEQDPTSRAKTEADPTTPSDPSKPSEPSER